MDRREMRTVESAFKTREALNEQNQPEKRIEGYFAVFDGTYELCPGATESIDPHAFDTAIADDVRALINHDTTLVLGRTAAHTLDLSIDSHGLYGSVLVNPNDQDAMNLYSRIERGDVNQCSFGFDILAQETDFRENGDVHWTIKDVKLYEVSVCTFPAYQTTEVSARTAEAEDLRKRKAEAWRAKQIESHSWLKKGEADEA